jgi:hypothetical protein
VTYESPVLQVHGCFDWMFDLCSVFVYLDSVYYDYAVLFLISTIYQNRADDYFKLIIRTLVKIDSIG